MNTIFAKQHLGKPNEKWFWKLTFVTLSLLLFSVGIVSGTQAADAPTVTFSLNNNRVIAGEPIFLTYTVTNTNSSVIQAVWTEAKSPQWLQVHLTDSKGKDVVPPIFSGKDAETRYDYGRRFKNKTDALYNVVLLKPGSTIRGRIALTTLTAAVPKLGTYQIKAQAKLRWAEAKMGADLAEAFPEVVFAEGRTGSAGGSVMTTNKPLPMSLLSGEKSKMLRLVVYSADPADLKAKAKTLRDDILTKTGAEAREAREELAAWPEASALDAWLPLMQQRNKNTTQAQASVFDSFMQQVIASGNPALLPFVGNLTWNLAWNPSNHNGHQTLELLYTSGDTATQKKILQMYADHHEEFPRNPANY